MKITLTFLFLMVSYFVRAQEFGLTLSYQFIAATEWNKANDVYNFSRPFLKNKQPNLANGVRLGIYYLCNTESAFSLGPSISFSWHRSAVENPNFKVGIHSLLLDLGLKIQYVPQNNDFNQLKISITPSVSSVLLTKFFKW